MSDAPDKKSRNRPARVIEAAPAMDDASVAEPVKKAAGLLDNYHQRAGAFDELFESNREIRAPYAKVFGALEEFSAPEMQRRADTCKRLVYEQGITYNV